MPWVSEGCLLTIVFGLGAHKWSRSISDEESKKQMHIFWSFCVDFLHMHTLVIIKKVVLERLK